MQGVSFCEQSIFGLSLCSLFFDWVHAVYGFVWPARASSAVLQSVTRLGASALEAARFAVSALEAARFAVPTCQPSGHTQRESYEFWQARQVPKDRYLGRVILHEVHIGQHAASFPPHV